MNLILDDAYRVAYRSLAVYLDARATLCDAMTALGLPTRNVDPLSCFAEVIAAHQLGGAIVPRAANPDFDVLLPAGERVQVKSLRVTTGKPNDNGLSWAACTRKGEKAQNPVLDADLVAVVVFLNHRPYAMLVFPVEDRERFPVLNVKDIGFRHVERLLTGGLELADWAIKVIDLRRCLDDQAATTYEATT